MSAAAITIGAFIERIDSEPTITLDNIARWENEARRLFKGQPLSAALAKIEELGEVLMVMQSTAPKATAAPNPVVDGLKKEGFQFPFELVQGTKNQYASADKSTCTFCAFAAGEALLRNLQTQSKLTPKFIDETIENGAKVKKQSKVKPGDYASLEEARLSFPTIKQLDYKETSVILQEKNKGQEYVKEVQDLTNFAKSNKGLAGAILIKGQVTFMIAADVRNAGRPQFYFYDSHSLPIRGCTNASLFTFEDLTHLAAFMKTVYPAIPDEGDLSSMAYNSIDRLVFTRN